MPSTIKTHVRKLEERDGLRTFQNTTTPIKDLYIPDSLYIPPPLKTFYADYAMLIKEDCILHQWRFPLVASFKQAHINLDEYNDEDYVNFDMIDETL